MRPSLIGLTLAAALMTGTALVSVPAAAAPSWHPQSSERLVKLPPSYLKKSLDNDFAQSELGQALTGTEEKIGYKTGTLSDLQQAVEQADGEVRLDLRHQFLGEKRAYLQLMSERNEMRRKHLKTKRKLFDRMLKKLAEDEAVAGQPDRQELIKLQDAALERFKSTVGGVDARLFETTTATESKYATQYATNMQAMEKLLARINNHDMNARPEDEAGMVLTKKQYLRRMASDIETEMAMLDQEETILGYMAKLVALDAMALAEDGLEAEIADSDVTASANPVDSVQFFLDN